MKRRHIINILLVIITIILFLLGYFSSNPDYTQILYIVGVVIGFWAIMRIFKIKQLATKN